MLSKVLKASIAFAVATAFSTAALAAPKPPPPPPPACGAYVNFFSPTAASACQGFYDKNVLSGNGSDEDIQEAAVEALLGSDIPNFDFNDYLKINASNGLIDFNTPLFGDVIVGIHWGGANGQANNVGNATGFFLFHFDTAIDSFTTTIPGLSGAVLYTNGTPPPPPPGVPEPATWAMMLLGFGAAGAALRRSRRKDVKLLQIA